MAEGVFSAFCWDPLPPGGGTWRVDSYHVVPTGWRRKLSYLYLLGPGDTIIPGEGRERMEVPAGPAYHYLTPPHDAEWEWRLRSSPGLPDTPLRGIGALTASTRQGMDASFLLSLPTLP